MTKEMEVLYIRCMEHWNVPQYNTKEATGAECAACEIEERERRVQELEEALRITSASIAKEMNRYDYEELDGSGAIITAEEVYKQSLEKAREQIRKGAKHE